MHPLILVLFGALALGLLGWLAWISYQSLRQARFLAAAAHNTLRGRSGESVAVHGEVRVSTPLRDGSLWRRVVVQERRGMGKNRRWVTVSDEAQMAGFTLKSEGVEIEVSDLPTEVQGAESDTSYAGGWLGASGKTTTYWLPVTPRVTVLGRLEGAGERRRLVKDATLGFLLSPHEPRKAATKELLKGIFGLVVLAAGVAGAVWIWTDFLAH